MMLQTAVDERWQAPLAADAGWYMGEGWQEVRMSLLGQNPCAIGLDRAIHLA
jgi:hypothetical protein